MQLAAETSHFPLLAAFGTVTWGERASAKTRVGGINFAAGAGAWAIGFQAWDGTRAFPSATTKPWWDASSFGFTGREHDQGGLVYARARFLSPSAGRWTQADPLHGQTQRRTDSPAAQNAYLYAHNAPTVLSDPSGEAVPVILVVLVVSYLLARTHDDYGGFDDEAFWDYFTIVGAAASIAEPMAACAVASRRSALAEAVAFGERQLQAKFKHAAAFGVKGNFNPASAAQFRDAMLRMMRGSSTRVIQAEYRGGAVTVFFDSSSNLAVITDAQGAFLSAWRLSAQQARYLITAAKIGGG